MYPLSSKLPSHPGSTVLMRVNIQGAITLYLSYSPTCFSYTRSPLPRIDCLQRCPDHLLPWHKSSWEGWMPALGTSPGWDGIHESNPGHLPGVARLPPVWISVLPPTDWDLSQTLNSSEPVSSCIKRRGNLSCNEIYVFNFCCYCGKSRVIYYFNHIHCAVQWH